MKLKSNKSLSLVTAVIAFICSLIIYFLRSFIPVNASDEYIYTIDVIYKFGFLPLLMTGIFCFLFGLYSQLKNTLLYYIKYFYKIGIALRIFCVRYKWIIKLACLIIFIYIICASVYYTSVRFIFLLVLSFLPYVCLCCLVCLFRLYMARRPFYNALIYGSLTWSMIIWLLTNILSCLNLIYGEIIACFWLAFFILLLSLILTRRKKWKMPSISGSYWLPIIISVFTLIAAIAYPPNNYDVMTYHMPRVAQWLQNHSLACYPTNIDRQIGMAPFNAMIALQSYAPAKFDYFVNLGQWFAYLACMVAISRLAALLNASANMRNAAIVFAATLPPAIIQASNTDCCLLVSFFILSMAIECIIWIRAKEERASTAIIFGLCLGFAILSKGSAYPIALPFVCLIAWHCLRHPHRSFIYGMLAALLVIVINVPHFARIMTGEGSMVAGAERNILKHPTPATFLNNVIYNFVSNHPILLSHGGKEKLANFSEKLGIKQTDTEIFPFGALEEPFDYYSTFDTYAPNVGQSIIIIFIFFAVLLKKFHPPLIYSCAVLAAFILFCLVLTWHAWNARIQLSLFLLAAPIAGMYIASLKKAHLRIFIMIALCILAYPPLFECVERPLLPFHFFNKNTTNAMHFLVAPREKLFFNGGSEYSEAYIGAADFIASKNPKLVGVNTGSNGLEYPLWNMLYKRMANMPEIICATPDQVKMPEYIFEYRRDDLGTQLAPQVLHYENGILENVYSGG